MHARRARTPASATITVTFDIGRDPDLAAVDVQNRVNQALGRMPADVRTNGITVTKNTAGFLGAPRLLLARTTGTTRCSSATTSTCTSATRSSACPASATSSSSASASSRCGCGSIPTSSPAAASRPATSSTRCASRTCRWPPAASATRRRAADQMYQLSVRAPGRLTEVAAVRERRRQGRQGRRARPREGRRPRRARRRELLVATCASAA